MASPLTFSFVLSFPFYSIYFSVKLILDAYSDWYRCMSGLSANKKKSEDKVFNTSFYYINNDIVVVIYGNLIDDLERS